MIMILIADKATTASTAAARTWALRTTAHKVATDAEAIMARIMAAQTREARGEIIPDVQITARVVEAITAIRQTTAIRDMAAAITVRQITATRAEATAIRVDMAATVPPATDGPIWAWKAAAHQAIRVDRATGKAPVITARQTMEAALWADMAEVPAMARRADMALQATARAVEIMAEVAQALAQAKAATADKAIMAAARLPMDKAI